ncbi:hypothetical protein AQUCO_01600197v1 [Aquilegia coerulea]|uniref:Uncharacterized protein n=1 Tax=Aquilegia coerulea TaxID=218851 RepID=A0A2G5DQS8_AQUCA|nr:hypothetical protein AQUCO_01600197v1 [Aquilegia coerulea]
MGLLKVNSLLTQFSSHTFTLPRQAPWGRRANQVAFKASSFTTCSASTERRSANYQPNIWEHKFLETLKNDYAGEVYKKRANSLKDEVRHLLDQHMRVNGDLALLELIDDIQRLGLGYIFERDIQIALSFLKENSLIIEGSDDLHTISLHFRLFRQHGINVSQDVFKVFTDPQGNFMEHLSQDVKGILSLYEASYLGIEGEDILDEAKVFSHKHLMNLKVKNIDLNLTELVRHALQFPLNRTIVRLEARWYIDAYSRRNDANSNLLELAKLDFNIVQASHQMEVTDLTRWWKNLGLSKKLPFTRDRLVECFLWTLGIAYEPEYKSLRKGITKLLILITTIDDIYDVYATLDEAKLFTAAVERWEINAVEGLPEYMKMCFSAFHNTVNEIAYDTLKEQGCNIIPYMQKTMMDQFNSFQLEAKWFHMGHKPKLEEYLDNAYISIGGPLVAFYVYSLLNIGINKEALECLESNSNIIRWSSMILRLTDDMATSKAELARGDNLKSIQCYMHDKDVTEEVARKHIRHLIDEVWKKLNGELWVESPLPPEFIRIALDTARVAETTYQNEDGHGIPDQETKTRVLSLLVDAIPVT